MGQIRHDGDTVGNLFSDIPVKLTVELFETLLKRSEYRIERIVSRGHSTPAGQWFDQDWDEWVLLIQGRAALEVEGENELVELGPGNYLLLPAHCRHRVAWTATGEDTIWLALHFPSGGSD